MVGYQRLASLGGLPGEAAFELRPECQGTAVCMLGGCPGTGVSWGKAGGKLS